MPSLGEALPQEIGRVRKILALYHQIGPAGMFGAMLIEQVLQRADQAMISGDVIAMIRVYEELKAIKE